MTLTEAIQAAKEESIKFPNEPIYIGWIEDKDYCIQTMPDMEDDSYYLNGELEYPES